MKQSEKFDLVKKYYSTRMANGKRLWDENRVKNAVKKGWITADEYQQITGLDDLETT